MEINYQFEEIVQPGFNFKLEKLSESIESFMEKKDDLDLFRIKQCLLECINFNTDLYIDQSLVLSEILKRIPEVRNRILDLRIDALINFCMACKISKSSNEYFEIGMQLIEEYLFFLNS